MSTAARQVESQVEPRGQTVDGGGSTEPASGALFPSAGAALAFLGWLAGSGPGHPASLRRSPDGRWWAEVPARGRRVTSQIWSSDGRPYARGPDGWRALTVADVAAPSSGATIAVEHWPRATTVDLLAQVRLPLGDYLPASRLHLLTPGPLVGQAVRRASGLNLDVSILPATAQPLSGDPEGVGRGPAMAIGWLRLEARSGTIPRSFVTSCSRLPGTTVAAPGTEDESILVEVHRRMPLDFALLDALVPRGGAWMFGSEDLGPVELRPAGAPVPGSLLLEVGGSPVAAPIPSPAALPEPIAVSLVRGRREPARADAVLVDDRELHWLSAFLRRRPVEEQAFLIPGAGAHLVLGPAGLANSLPFGTPLTRVGPGGLYVEQGTEFSPPLPADARRRCFGLTREVAVAVVRGRHYRFPTDRLVPAWALWAGKPPTVASGLSGAARRVLENLPPRIRRAEAAGAERLACPPDDDGIVDAGEDPVAAALRAVIAGELIEAARLLERGGHHGPAGRLFERAAFEQPLPHTEDVAAPGPESPTPGPRWGRAVAAALAATSGLVLVVMLVLAVRDAVERGRVLSQCRAILESIPDARRADVEAKLDELLAAHGSRSPTIYGFLTEAGDRAARGSRDEGTSALAEPDPGRRAARCRRTSSLWRRAAAAYELAARSGEAPPPDGAGGGPAARGRAALSLEKAANCWEHAARFSREAGDVGPARAAYRDADRGYRRAAQMYSSAREDLAENCLRRAEMCRREAGPAGPPGREEPRR